MKVLYNFIAVVGALWLLVIVVHKIAYGAPPEHSDPALAPWFQSLHDADGMSCCSIADCRATDTRHTQDGYEVWIEDEWIPVPPEKILQNVSNPTGRPVVCYSPNRGILCFVRPSES